MTERRPLTPPEQRVVLLVAEGKTNRQIGDILLLTEDGVKAHLKRIFQAWGVRTRGELTAAAIQDGYAPCPNCQHAPGTARLLTSAVNSLRQLASNLETQSARITSGGGDRG